MSRKAVDITFFKNLLSRDKEQYEKCKTNQKHLKAHSSHSMKPNSLGKKQCDIYNFRATTSLQMVSVNNVRNEKEDISFPSRRKLPGLMDLLTETLSPNSSQREYLSKPIGDPGMRSMSRKKEIQRWAQILC